MKLLCAQYLLEKSVWCYIFFLYLFASFQCNYLYVTYSIHIEQLQSRCNRQWWRWWRRLWIYIFEMICHIPFFFQTKIVFIYERKGTSLRKYQKKLCFSWNEPDHQIVSTGFHFNELPNQYIECNVLVHASVPQLSTPFLLQLNKLSPKTVVTSFMQ